MPRVTPGAPVDLAALGARLKQAAPDSQLDDHGRWIARLKRLADTIVWTAYGILILIAIATAATVTFATRAGLEAHHEMVALLHQMGAHAGFIARAFERHYALATFGASALGASLAALLFVAAGGLEFVGVEAVPFLPPIALKLSEVAWLAGVPVVATAIAWATARLSVLAVVREFTERRAAQDTASAGISADTCFDGIVRSHESAEGHRSICSRSMSRAFRCSS